MVPTIRPTRLLFRRRAGSHIFFFFLLVFCWLISVICLTGSCHSIVISFGGTRKGKEWKTKKRNEGKKSEVLRHQIVAQFSLASTPSFYFVVRIDKPAAKGSWGSSWREYGNRDRKKQVTGCKWITENPIASSVSSILYWNTKTG